MFSLGRRAFGRVAVLAAAPLAAVLGAGLLMPASAAACPTGAYCTDSTGTYTLTVPPLTGQPFVSEYASCEWDLHVDFGDKTSKDYKFNGEVGLTDSHTFPPYGEYLVQSELSNGHRTDASTGQCPDYNPPIARVLYQSEQEIAEEEALTQAEKEAKEKKKAEEIAALEAKKQKEREEREAREKAAKEKLGAGSGGSGPEGSTGETQTVQTFWRSCRRIQVHGVGCAKARKVIGRARRKNLFEDGPQEILGFTCHLTGTRPAQISCRRGKRRILAPL
jgi:hypothetical protein